MTTTEHETNEREARELLERRLEDFRYFCGDAYATADETEEYDDEHGSVNDYGLSWEHEMTNHRTGEETYRHVLSTGGPHDEFQVTFEPVRHGYAVSAITYVYLPWFDRVKISGADYDMDDATAFYNQHFAEMVEITLTS